MRVPEKIFITGTDTGVGKTVLSLMLMKYFYRNGLTPFYIKPFQTGCANPQAHESDPNFIYKHTEELKDKDPAESVIFCFREPKAPLFAARAENKKITGTDIDKIIKSVREREKTFKPVIIEGAGGVLVPINEDLSTADMIRMLAADTVLVARAGLGTINHTLLSIEALQNRKIKKISVVMIDPETSPTPEEMISENIEAIYTMSGIKVAGVIGRVDDFSRPATFPAMEKIFSAWQS